MDRSPVKVMLMSIAGTILVACFLYVGSYLALLTPEDTWLSQDSGYQYIDRTETYRLESQIVERIFAPLHQLDRKLRPGFWHTERPVEYFTAGPEFRLSREVSQSRSTHPLQHEEAQKNVTPHPAGRVQTSAPPDESRCDARC